ncbi:MAG TPA: hypothetical protein VL360_00055 [Gammaproteobacteria bacterium]|jgi:hypothetical protein|nr:hypothetical protein [Gammaproteobacteria bacterium]
MQDRQKTPEEIAAEIAKNAEHNRKLPLFQQDKGVRKQNICSYVAIDMLGMFARTCQLAEADTAFLRLMTAAVGAEPESYKLEEDGSYKQKDETSLAAIAILKRHPELLFVKGMVTDHVGRKIFASPYRLLLGAGDVWALKQVHEEIIPMIKDGEVRAQAQFQEQFPNCKLPFDPELGEAALYDERNEKLIAQVIVQLKTIADVITADPCTNGVATSDATTAAVAALREIFAPKQDEIIRTGLHFPLAIMQAIFKEYDDHFNPWTGEQLSFFSREVIGAALAASTAVDGQCCKYGLKDLDAKTGPDRRDGLFCRHPKGIPLGLAPLNDKLGRTVWILMMVSLAFQSSSRFGYFDWYNKNGLSFGLGSSALAPFCCVAAARGKLMSSKNFILGEIMRTPREEKTSRCVIC